MYKPQVEEGNYEITIKSGLLYGQNYAVIIVQFACAYRRSSRGIYLVYLTFYARNVLQKF